MNGLAASIGQERRQWGIVVGLMTVTYNTLLPGAST